MSDWPADPRLDDSLRRLVETELAAARTDLAGMSKKSAAHRSRGGRTVAGLGALAAIAIVASLVIRGGTTRGPGGGPGASESPVASESVAIASSTTPATTGIATVVPALSPTPEPSSISSPASGTWTPTGTLTTVDNGSATLLLDGRVLIVGNAATSPEIYEPKTGKFSSTGQALRDGNVATATRLADGRVLFVGGNNETTTFATAQIYDPATGKFSPTGSLITGRMGNTATLLADGRVLIAGGSTFNYAVSPMAVPLAYHPGAVPSKIPERMTGPAMLASAELYDPVTGKFSPTGSMTTGRETAAAVLLADGRVLIAGGGNEGSAAAASAELYDPKTGKFSGTGSMLVAQYAENAMRLRDGRVLLSAGNDGNGPVYSLEIYDPKTGKFSSAGSMDTSRGFYTATLLADGRVLLVGGYDTTAPKGAGYLASSELYDPATGKLSPTGSMSTGRLVNSLTTLLDGRVLAAGGVGAGEPGNLSSAELYQP
jgi:hypothetical protein